MPALRCAGAASDEGHADQGRQTVAIPPLPSLRAEFAIVWSGVSSVNEQSKQTSTRPRASRATRRSVRFSRLDPGRCSRRHDSRDRAGAQPAVARQGYPQVRDPRRIPRDTQKRLAKDRGQQPARTQSHHGRPLSDDVRNGGPQDDHRRRIAVASHHCRAGERKKRDQRAADCRVARRGAIR